MRPAEASRSGSRQALWLALRRELESIACALFPGPCEGCGGVLGLGSRGGFCPACWISLPIAARSDHALATPIDQFVAALAYRDLVVTLHRHLKFDGTPELLRPLAERMVQRWRVEGTLEIDAVVPVPHDPWRFGPRRRLPLRLARRVARGLRIPLRSDLLRKTRRSPSQTTLGAVERRSSLLGTMLATPSAAGASLLVIDDVSTTGSTLIEAARALRAAGARRVSALVLARTDAPGTIRAQDAPLSE